MHANSSSPIKRKRSLGKLLEATVMWAIVASVVAWLIYKEINNKQIEIRAAGLGRTIVFQTNNLHGIDTRSPLVCQGITIGNVIATRAEADPEAPDTLRISITARLDEAYSAWAFKPQATVESSSVISGLTGASIHLQFAGQLTPEKFASFSQPGNAQTFTLTTPESTSELLRELITQTNTILAPLSEPTTPPEGWQKTEPPMQIEAIVFELAQASTMFRAASNHLENEFNQESSENLIATFRKMDAKLDTLTTNANALVEKVDRTITGIDGKLDDTLGANPAERALLRRQAQELLTSGTRLTENLDDLTSRTGDTFLGRRFIRKPDNDPEAPPRRTSSSPRQTGPRSK